MAKKTNGKTSKNGTNGASEAAETSKPEQLDPETLQKIATVRSQVRESFGKLAMAMMAMPRYRSQTIGDMQHIILEPLIRDRVAIAYPKDVEDNPLADVAGMAIWASVSEEVDGKIREQIKAGVWPVRLKAEEWNSGEINWLLDVIAGNPKATAQVLTNFRQVVKEGDLRMHPIIGRLVEKDVLEKLGATKGAAKPAPSEA